MSHRTRTPSSKSRSRRISETRGQNYEEAAGRHFALVWDVVEDGDSGVLGLEGAMSYGPELFVPGYERIHLALDFDFGDVGNDMITAFIVAQGSNVGGESPTHWFDLHTDEAGDGFLARKLWSAVLTTGANGKTRIAWPDQRRVWRFMRFKLFVDGTIFTDATAKLRASRVMDSM